MVPSWDDELLTVKQIAEHLQVNQQTVRNWIDSAALPAVRIGRRVRVRRADMERVLGEGLTAPATPEPPPPGLDQVRDERREALDRARRLLGKRSAVRRADLADGLLDLAAAVDAAPARLAEVSAEQTSDRPPASEPLARH